MPILRLKFFDLFNNLLPVVGQHSIIRQVIQLIFPFSDVLIDILRMFLTAHSKRNGSLFLLLQEDDGNLVVIDEVAANVIDLLILYAIFNFIRFVSIGYVYE